MKHYFFRDKDCAPNLEDGREYHAAGVVSECMDNSASGKELAVFYINPFSVCVEHAWRSYDSVVLFEAPEYEWRCALEKHKQNY